MGSRRDTQSHVIARGAHQLRALQGGTLPHHRGIAVYIAGDFNARSGSLVTFAQAKRTNRGERNVTVLRYPRGTKQGFHLCNPCIVPCTTKASAGNRSSVRVLYIASPFPATDEKRIGSVQVYIRCQ